MPAVPPSTSIWKVFKATNSVTLKLVSQKLRLNSRDVSSSHRARRETNTADPIEVSRELLLLSHSCHVYAILAISICTAVADEGFSSVCGLFLLKAAHRRSSRNIDEKPWFKDDFEHKTELK
jgi:hypothetical protein